MRNTDLWLIRHGRPTAESRGLCYGSLDVPLAHDSIPELTQTFARLPELHAVYSSPRQRCLDTARLLSPQPIVVPELRELDFGDFEAKTYDQIATTHPGLYAQWMSDPASIEFPGGESYASMQARVLPAIRKLRELHRGQSIAIVSHGGVNRIALSHVLGLPDQSIFRLGQRYGAVNLIRYYGDYPVVELVNGF